MGCSIMKEIKAKQQKQSYLTQESLKTHCQINPVKMQETSSYQHQAKIPQNQYLSNSKHPRLHVSLVEIQNRKMEKQKYKTQFIVNLLSEENECYRLKDEYLQQQSGNSSTFSSPLKKKITKSENKSTKTTKKNPIDQLVNIL